MPETAWIQMPWALRPDTLLGAASLAVIAALLGELAWRRLRWPRLVGPLAVGSALALAGAGAQGDEPALRLAVDLALGVLLFEAGARVDLRWFARNRALAATAALESIGSAAAVWAVARVLGLPDAAAVPLALVAMGVSPAVLMRVAGDSGAAGQATERLLALAALNTLAAALALRLYGGGVLLTEPASWWRHLPALAFGFVATGLLATVLGEGLGLLARRLDLRDDHAAVLMLGCVLLALVVAKTLGLSTLLVPLVAGLWLRWRSERAWVWRRQFGSAGAALVLVMFVAVASAPTPAALASAAGVALALLGARAVAKAVAVFALARPSGLSWRQAGAVSAGLLPLSAGAWVMALDHAARHPAAGALMMPVLLAMLALVELPGALATRAALQAAGEIERPADGGGRP